MIWLYALFLLQFLIGAALLGESTRRSFRKRDTEAALIGCCLTGICAFSAAGAFAGVYHYAAQ